MKAGGQLLAITLLVAAAAGGWYFFGGGRESTGPTAGIATGNSPRAPGARGMNRGPVLVVTAPVEIDNAGEDIRSIGTLAAAQDVVLYPEVTGIVAEILVKPNEKVKAGDVLVRLDDEDQKVEVERATIARDDARRRASALRSCSPPRTSPPSRSPMRSRQNRRPRSTSRSPNSPSPSARSPHPSPARSASPTCRSATW